jgi:hypothetical protein
MFGLFDRFLFGLIIFCKLFVVAAIIVSVL